MSFPNPFSIFHSKISQKVILFLIQLFFFLIFTIHQDYSMLWNLIMFNFQNHPLIIQKFLYLYLMNSDIIRHLTFTNTNSLIEY